jgi:Radical SAM superfamily
MSVQGLEPAAVLPLATVTPDRRQRPLLKYMAPCEIWALSTYTACEFRCVYCITGAQGASIPQYPKGQVAAQLRRELGAIDTEATVGVGSLCDAYPSVELRYGVTRAAIEELIALRRRFVIVTKGSAILRDRDLLASYAQASVTISLCSVNEDALRRVDPKAPSAEERLEVIHTLAASGVGVVLSAAPWIPGVSDAQALIARVDGSIPIQFGVLNVLSPEVAATAYGRRFTQDAVNETFMREFQRTEPRRNVRWLRPVPADGSARLDPLRDFLDNRECSLHGGPRSVTGSP